MARGFIFGVFWGAVAGVGALGVISLVSPLPQSPDVAVTVPGSTDDTAPEAAADTDVGTGRDADLVGAQPTVPVEGQGPDAVTVTTEPGPLPDVGGDGEALGTPEAPSENAAEIDVGSDDPVVATDPAPAPVVPQSEPELSISTDPAQPVLPEISEAQPGFGAPAPEAPATPDVSLSEDAAPDTADAPAAGQTAEVDQPDIATEPAAPPAEAEESPSLPSISEPPQSAAAPEPSTDRRPTIGKPAQPLVGNRVAEVVPEADRSIPDGPPAIERYAAPYEEIADLPMMSIVLIDGEGSLGAEALEGFPYPLTFAVDPNLPDAAERMAAHRAAGFEVVALIDMPQTATAQDAEVALAASFTALPETVAVLEGVRSGIQGNRPLSDQVTAIVNDSGRGLVTQDNGLNTVLKLAQRAGVPSAVVFRDFDGAGQTPTVMRRFLDQAAFRARQEGAVIMLGRLQPDTISALLLWGLQDRASRVALVPVSAVLTRETVAE